MGEADVRGQLEKTTVQYNLLNRYKILFIVSPNVMKIVDISSVLLFTFDF